MFAAKISRFATLGCRREVPKPNETETLGACLHSSDSKLCGPYSRPRTGTVEDFDSRTGCGYCFTTGPVVLPTGVVFTAGALGANTGVGAVLGTGNYFLAVNGSWSEIFFAGVDSGANFMIFEFPSAVSAVSALMNYAAGVGDDPIIEALDANLSVLESYNLAVAAPISTPGGFNAAEWRGVVRGSADIKALRVKNAYIVVDILTFGGDPVSSVPEPSSAFLTVVALALLGSSSRRLRALAGHRRGRIERAATVFAAGWRTARFGGQPKLKISA